MMGRTVRILGKVLGTTALAGVLASCSMFKGEQRAPWRREAELACVKSGAVKETALVRMREPLEGPGSCGADFPFKVTALGDNAMLAFAPETRTASVGYSPVPYPLRPPSGFGAQPGGVPLQISPPRQIKAGPATIQPAATLTCPMVHQLDLWIEEVVQPAAARHFGQAVTEIRTAGSYGCRRINHSASGSMSEHAYANAIDIMSFVLADGRKVVIAESAKSNDERADFLLDIQNEACRYFNTMLAPGANALHYDHIHIDLARRRSGKAVCKFTDYRSPERKMLAQQRMLTTGSVKTALAMPPVGKGMPTPIAKAEALKTLPAKPASAPRDPALWFGPSAQAKGEGDDTEVGD